MGAFFLLRTGDYSALEAEIAEAERILSVSGFGTARKLVRPDLVIFAYPEIISGELALKEFLNGDFVLTSGTFLFDGKSGVHAAEAFYERFSNYNLALDEAFGHFAVIIRKGTVTSVLSDKFGGYHVYLDKQRKVISSSLLVAAAFQKRLTCSRQAIFEYVFNGVVSGNETLFDEITLLPKDAKLTIEKRSVTFHASGSVPSLSFASMTVDELLEQALADLDEYFAEVAKLFENRVVTALSGGYDSRLILAMLKRHGIAPRLYVYGRRSDGDVRLASAIASGEGLSIDYIDKEKDVVSVDDFAGIVEQNFYAVDGYIWSGIFDNGAEHRERARRVAGGAMSLNGGGGEIYRNFFYLPDRTYEPRILLWTFYAQFDPSSCTELFNANRFYDALEDKIAAVVGRRYTRLPRTIVEWLYHAFRCRAWDGKVNSINSRFGSVGVPFLQATISEHASQIPIHFKNHGAFEAALISHVDRRLASYAPSYGHDFDADPPARRIVHDWGTYFRPATIRRLTFRIKNRARSNQTWNSHLNEPHVSSALPQGINVLSRLFKLGNINS